MGKSLTLAEVQERVHNSFEQNVEVLEYVNKRVPIKLHCLQCGNIWEASATSVLYLHNVKGLHQCPVCIKKGKTVACAYCGKLIYRIPSDINSNKSGYFYCSHTCGNLHKNQLRKENGEWKDACSSYRARALDQMPNQCAVCGWNEDTRVLEVHHIDSDRSNNKIENLCILCPTCHRKITLGYYDLQLTPEVRLIQK